MVSSDQWFWNDLQDKNVDRTKNQWDKKTLKQKSKLPAKAFSFIQKGISQ